MAPNKSSQVTPFLRDADTEAPGPAERIRELEAEAERWRDAAQRTADEIGERARTAREAYERRIGELDHTLAALRTQLEAVRRQLGVTAGQRDAALHAVERKAVRIAVLKARLITHERRRIAMTRTLSWRLTAPFRTLGRAVEPGLKRLARLRRRLSKAPSGR